MSSAVVCPPVATGRPGAQPLLPLTGAATEVPVLAGGTVGYVDLDAAASRRPLAAVTAAVTDALPGYASVHRGAGYLSQLSTARYESARAAVAGFVGARDGDVCVITRNTTDALNLLAGCIPWARRCSCWTASTTPTCCPGSGADR